MSITSTTAVIVGAGQAGLAMSHSLTRRGIDHIVLERGRVGERWHSERWDSLQLLTPNWMTRLPGFSYQGDDPNGFMTMPEVARFFQTYADSFSAPVVGDTIVFRAGRSHDGYHLETSTGVYRCKLLVAATGAAATPLIPELASGVPAPVEQLTPKFYKRPSQLPDGRVLVVGASASGIQLAREIHLSGRDVTLAVGRHTKLPRSYRGVDIHRWLDRLGSLDRPYDTFTDIEAARREPSLQLVGSDEGRTIDLAELQRLGVRLGGRVESISGGVARFSGDLGDSVREAETAERALLARIDRWADQHGVNALESSERPSPLNVHDEARTVDLRSGGFGTVLWATGYRPDYSWIDVPLVQRDGRIDHDGGVVPHSPGLYLMGLPVMRTRKSTFIDGVAADAEALASHMAQRLGLAATMLSGATAR